MLRPPPVTSWVVLAPVKRLDRAKSRLSGRAAPQRRALAMAFAIDTIRSVVACGDVEEVLVLTSDADLRSAATDAGAAWAPEDGALDLNEVLTRTARQVAAERPWAGVAALVCDLPALRTDELHRALAAAALHRRAFVADAAGTGTTLLSAAPGVELDPHFGPRSRAAHAASGAVALEPGPVPGLRRDVDTEVDLWDAGRLGLGPSTAALLDA